MSDIDEYTETLKEGGILEETELKQLCDKVKEIMMDENNIVQIRSACDKMISILVKNGSDLGQE